MFTKTFSSLRPRASVIHRLSVRDPALHAAAVLGITAIMVHAGFGVWAWVLGGATALFELLSRMLARPLAGIASEVTTSQIRDIWICSVLSATSYAIPGVLLAGQPSIGLMLSGMLWLFGVMGNVTNAYARFPIFSVGMSVPLVLGMITALVMAMSHAHTAASMADWWIAALLVALYVFTNIQAAQQHAEINRALASARREAADRMHRLEVLHRQDSLTGLLNRGAFDDALAQMLLKHRSSRGEIAVVLIDLDSFKPINDTYSHEAGDQVLAITARRLKTVVGDGLVGRLGGDEFICATDNIADVNDVIALGTVIQEAVSEPITWRERELKINASIGIAMTGRVENTTVTGLCAAADRAMFRAKSAPNHRPVLYDPDRFAPTMSAIDRQLLTDALRNGQIRPYYQPKVYLPTGEIIGFEALARWEHPKRGVLGPGEFLSQIDEMGLQGHFLSQITSQVVEDLGALLDRGLDPGQVSINVPEVALATHTGRHELATIISKHPFLRGHLTFEITEDVFIARAAEAIQASITTFRNLGIRISLDDFGTGFASFHHLRQLDFDELKIDTSFVAGLGRDPTTEVLVQGFLSIASGLGVSVIAEGVETEEQRRDLLNLGCIAAQGYLFSPAVPIKDACEMLVNTPAGAINPPRPSRAEALLPRSAPGVRDAP